MVPGPSCDRVPPPAEGGADRTAGGAGHEWRGETSGSRRRWLACGLSGGCGAPFVGRVLGRVATRSQPGEHGRRALGGRTAGDLLGASERHRQCDAEDGGHPGGPDPVHVEEVAGHEPGTGLVHPADLEPGEVGYLLGREAGRPCLGGELFRKSQI